MSTPRLPPPLRLAAMSVIEVLVASSVLVLAVSAGIGAIGTSSTTSMHRQNADRALAEIQSQMESFQAMDDQTLQAQFSSGDNLYFPVTGLSPGNDPSTGAPMKDALLVQRVRVVNGIRLTTLRFLASWVDTGGPGFQEQFFHFTERR